MTQDTKQIALDHLNRLNSGDVTGAGALMAEDCINHAAIPEAQGRAGFVRSLGKLREAFPDIRFNLEDAFSEGDRATMRVTVTGTNKGPLNFVHMPLPATGKSVKFEQIHIVRVNGGKIVEHWLGMDAIAMFRQLGLKVSPAA